MQASDHSLAVGYADRVAYYAGSRAPASLPLRVGTVPEAARCLQHRPHLDACWVPAATDRNAPAHDVVLVGTAGVGKTQQAIRLADTAWREGGLDLLVWVTADSREAIVATYAQVLAELTGSDPAGPEQAAQAFLAWLRPGAAEPRRRWLVVLDDVADPDDLRGLWPPDHPDGRTLITTRRRDFAQPGLRRRLVPVEEFTPAEAAAYLTETLAAHGRDDDPEEIRDLAQELGHLPLALSQAAAYLVGAGLDCAAYRRLLGRPGGKPLAELVPGPGALPDGQHVSVADAWQTSVERAERLPPAGLARPLLELASLLPPEGIPAYVFTSPAAKRHLSTHRTAPPSGDGGAPADEVTAALRVLDGLGLIVRTPADPLRAVRVPPVLQRVTYEALPAKRARDLAGTFASALAEAADASGDDPAFTPILLRAFEMLRKRAEPALWETAGRRDAFSASMDIFFANETPMGVHRLFFRVGESLGITGQPAAARGHFEWLMGEALRRHGPETTIAVRARERVAHWRGEAGDAAGAAAAYAEILDEEIRLFGPHHEITFTTRAALGRWHGRAGDAAGAAGAYAQLLPLQQHKHSPDHPDVFETRAQLAQWQGESGDAYGAAMAYEALMHDLLRVTRQRGGPTLPTETFVGVLVVRPNWFDVFDAHHGHAHWRGRAGDPAGAATSLTYLLDEQTRILGPGHPRVRATREELTRWTNSR
ncbi:NB-ARC domain-containing protein [Streptomyces sp. NPDC020742]|uniref:NB-ARC domain-containing protein n=1 Tax=Streptomyces sp. NPDC020742 TaxID=3154897 RepID=UPI0033DC269B